MSLDWLIGNYNKKIDPKKRMIDQLNKVIEFDSRCVNEWLRKADYLRKHVTDHTPSNEANREICKSKVRKKLCFQMIKIFEDYSEQCIHWRSPAVNLLEAYKDREFEPLQRTMLSQCIHDVCQWLKDSKLDKKLQEIDGLTQILDLKIQKFLDDLIIHSDLRPNRKLRIMLETLSEERRSWERFGHLQIALVY